MRLFVFLQLVAVQIAGWLMKYASGDAYQTYRNLENFRIIPMDPVQLEGDNITFICHPTAAAFVDYPGMTSRLLQFWVDQVPNIDTMLINATAVELQMYNLQHGSYKVECYNNGTFMNRAQLTVNKRPEAVTNLAFENLNMETFIVAWCSDENMIPNGWSYELEYRIGNSEDWSSCPSATHCSCAWPEGDTVLTVDPVNIRVNTTVKCGLGCEESVTSQVFTVNADDYIKPNGIANLKFVNISSTKAIIEWSDPMQDFKLVYYLKLTSQDGISTHITEHPTTTVDVMPNTEYTVKIHCAPLHGGYNSTVVAETFTSQSIAPATGPPISVQLMPCDTDCAKRDVLVYFGHLSQRNGTIEGYIFSNPPRSTDTGLSYNSRMLSLEYGVVHSISVQSYIAVGDRSPESTLQFMLENVETITANDLDLIAEKDGDTCRLKWTPMFGVDGYLIQTCAGTLDSPGCQSPLVTMEIESHVTSHQFECFDSDVISMSVLKDGKIPGLMEDWICVYDNQMVPGEVYNVKEEDKGSTYIKVSWQHQCTPKTGRPTEFNIFAWDESRNSTEAAQVSGITNSCTITHLEPYTRYQVYVQASGEGGEGLESSDIYITTRQAIPSAPLLDNVTVDNHGRIMAHWHPPLYPRGVIDKYTVMVEIGDGVIQEFHTTKTFVLTSALEGGKAYNVSVVAINEAGMSEKLNKKLVEIPIREPDKIEKINASHRSNNIHITYEPPEMANGPVKYRVVLEWDVASGTPKTQEAISEDTSSEMACPTEGDVTVHVTPYNVRDKEVLDGPPSDSRSVTCPASGTKINVIIGVVVVIAVLLLIIAVVIIIKVFKKKQGRIPITLPVPDRYVTTGFQREMSNLSEQQLLMISEQVSRSSSSGPTIINNYFHFPKISSKSSSKPAMIKVPQNETKTEDKLLIADEKFQNNNTEDQMPATCVYDTSETPSVGKVEMNNTSSGDSGVEIKFSLKLPKASTDAV